MRARRIAITSLALLLLAGCTAAPGAAGVVPPSDDYPGVRFVDDVDFGGPDGIRLDVCLPESTPAGGSPTVLAVHGGGWREGDKGQPLWRDSCAWLASEGFAVFQPNYRLAPEHVFPAALEDLETAAHWLRQPRQVERFGHDPSRLAGFGDSAGGNLVALLATRGTGAGLDAVVELSAPIDLTAAGALLGDLGEGFQQVQLDYLGCADSPGCAAATEASPMHHVDAGDPPFLIVHSLGDFIPFEQAEAFALRLGEAGVDAELVPVEGSEHALGMLDGDLRERIAIWLRERLADAERPADQG
jgi:acetyl esterase/lipase